MMHQITTDDLFKGAYFLCNGGVLKDVVILSNQKVTFTIEGENLNEAEQRFYTGKAVADPLLLKESLNYLRDLLRRKLDETRTLTRRSNETGSYYSNRVRKA